MKKYTVRSMASFAESAGKTIEDHRLEDFKMGFDAEDPPEKHLSLIHRLEAVAGGVADAPRDGEGDDSPEGNVKVTMSHTFAEGLTMLLREAAAQLKRPF